jgi:DNA-binding PadR family transcriptional regulator
MKSENIRLEILSIILNRPNHGYFIFKHLQSKGFDIERTEVYRNIRILKTEGLIEGEKQETSKGIEKEILRITKEGKIFYNESMFLTLQRIMDLMNEQIAVKINEFGIQFFKDHKSLNFIKQLALGKKIRILLDFQHDLISSMHYHYIASSLGNLGKHFEVFIQYYDKPIRKFDEFTDINDYMEGLDKLEKVEKIEPHSIDVILGFRYDQKNEIVTKMQNEWGLYLKSQGFLFFGTYLEPIRKDPMFDELISGIFHENDQEFIEALPKVRMTEGLRGLQKLPILDFHLKDNELLEQLNQFFKEIEKYAIANYFTIFACKTLR